MIRYVLSLLAFATLMFGQLTPTRIGKHQINETVQEWHEHEPQARDSYSEAGLGTDIMPHRLGETFSEWLRLNQLDLSYICGKHNRRDNRMDFKGVCKKLSAMRDTGHGDFYTTNQTGHTFGWRFTNGTVAEYSVDGKWQGTIAMVTPEQNIKNGKDDTLVTKTNSREYTWKFADGRLSAVTVTPDWNAIYKLYSEEGIARHPEIVPAFLEEITLLTQTYGKPSKVEMVPYGNAYGAHWERSRVMWNAPDGTQIIAFERIEFNHQGQLELVSFHSKESLKQTEQTKPNPYRQ